MTKKNIIVFILVIGLVIIFWSSSSLKDYFQGASVWLQKYGQMYPYSSILLFIGLSALSAILISFSSFLLVPAAVVLWGNLGTVIILLTSWFLGSIASYLIGRYGGYPLVYKLVSNKKLTYYENLVSQKLSATIIFLFRLTLPSEIPGYLLGIFRYPLLKYLLITALAEMPYAFYTVYAIESILSKRPLTFIIATIIWLAMVFILVRLFYKVIKNPNPMSNYV